MSTPFVPRLKVLAAALLFSTGGVAVKSCTFNGFQIVSLRCAVGAVALLLFLPAARRRWSVAHLVVGAFFASTMILFVMANKNTTAANAIFLQSTAPLYILLLAPRLLGERTRPRDLVVMAGMAVGLGLFLSEASSASATAPAPALGNLFGALSGLSWTGTVLGLRWLEQRRGAGQAPVAVVAGNVIACLVCLPFALPLGETHPSDWALVVYLGIFQIAAAYAFLTTALAEVPALDAALLLLLEPVFNPVWTFLAHGEVPGPRALAGAAVILAATAAKNVWDATASRRAEAG